MSRARNELENTLIVVPFTASVSLRSITVKAGPSGKTPSAIHLVHPTQSNCVNADVSSKMHPGWTLRTPKQRRRHKCWMWWKAGKEWSTRSSESSFGVPVVRWGHAGQRNRVGRVGLRGGKERGKRGTTEEGKLGRHGECRTLQHFGVTPTELTLRAAKFAGITSLTVYIPSNKSDGDEDTTRVY